MINPITFLKEVRVELTKVSWPSKDKIIRLTVVVVAVSILVGVYIGGLDALFTVLLKNLVK